MAITINGSGTISGITAGGLPDGAVTADDLASTLDLSGKTVTGVGITEADQWRLTASATAFNGALTSNLERNDTNFSLIGSGMTESSGVFSFPTTGIYKIDFVLGGEADTDPVAFLYAELTTDNGSNWATCATALISGRNTSSEGSTAPSGFILDVTDTSNIKIRFSTSSFATESTIFGSTTDNITFFTFIRLGDT